MIFIHTVIWNSNYYFERDAVKTMLRDVSVVNVIKIVRAFFLLSLESDLFYQKRGLTFWNCSTPFLCIYIYIWYTCSEFGGNLSSSFLSSAVNRQTFWKHNFFDSEDPKTHISTKIPNSNFFTMYILFLHYCICEKVKEA